METKLLTLLTIIAESVLKERLIEEVNHAGAKGYTVTSAEGSGSRHRRVGELLGDNIRLETVVSSEVHDRLMTTLAQNYFPKFAVIAFSHPVHVIRGDKYV